MPNKKMGQSSADTANKNMEKEKICRQMWVVDWAKADMEYNEATKCPPPL